MLAFSVASVSNSFLSMDFSINPKSGFRVLKVLSGLIKPAASLTVAALDRP
jgi:hypothetical protein